MIEELAGAEFWIALGKIMWINVLLSGDNAVVIALASRNLAPGRQKKAIVFGSAAAIVLRIVLTLFAVQLLQLPWLKLVGAALLVWIGISLLRPNKTEDNAILQGADNLGAAIRTILFADLVMSLDNVVAVAAVAETGPEATRLILLVLGLGLSIPLIVFGSTVLLKLMERAPLIVTGGAALLGFIAGEMAESDPVVAEWIVAPTWFAYVLGGALALLVVLLGTWRSKRARRQVVRG